MVDQKQLGDANDSSCQHREDAVLYQGRLLSIPSCSGSPCQPAHPHGARHPRHSVKQRGSHLSPVCFPLLSPEKAHVHRQNAAVAVTAGLGFSPTAPSCTGAALVEKLQPLNPPSSGGFGFKKYMYMCTHAHRSVIAMHIHDALCVRGINLHRQIALRLC